MSAATVTSTEARNRRAIGLLIELLGTPGQRPSAWEAIHVEALEDRLASVLDVLTGAAEEGTS